MEHDAVCLLGLQTQHLVEMPGYGLTLAVLIAREPDRLGLLGCGFQLLDKILLVGGDFIFRSEVALDIDAHALLLKVTDMAEAGHHLEVRPQKFLNGFRLGGRLDND